MSKANQNAAQTSQNRGMPENSKMGGKNANAKGLKDVDQNTTPTKATDRVGSQRPGSSQGNISNAGSR